MNTTKQCLDCKQDKLLIDFSKNNSRRDGLCIYCKSCAGVRRRKYYDEHKDREHIKHKEYAKNNRERIRFRTNITTQKRRANAKAELVAFHGGQCKICGYNRCLAALDFHHLDPKTKEFTIGTAARISFFDVESLIEESKKCILLCSNCHRELHAGFLSLPQVVDNQGVGGAPRLTP